MSLALQLLSAFLAMLGGLLISADFLGTERLNQAEDGIRQRIRAFADRASDFYGSSHGIAVTLWGRIGAILFVAITVVLYLLQLLWRPFPWLLLFVIFVAAFTGAALLRDRWPGLLFFVFLPLLGALYVIESLIEISVAFPIVRLHNWAARTGIPYLLKLLGALFVVLAFVTYASSYFF